MTAPDQGGSVSASMELLVAAGRGCAAGPYRARLPRRAGRRTRSWSSAIERLAAGLAAEGIGPGDAVALLLPNDPSFVASYFAITGARRRRRAGQPGLQAGRARVLLPAAAACARSSATSAAPACASGSSPGWDEPAQVITTSAAHGQALTLDMLMRARARPSSSRARPDEPLVYQFSSGSTGRPKRVARTHAQCAARRSTTRRWASARRTGSSARSRSSTPTGWAAACSPRPRTGATLVILEDPNPFLLRRQRALELLEHERVHDLPRRAVQLPADGGGARRRPTSRRCGSASPRAPRCRGPFFDAFLDKFGVPVRQLYGCTEAGTLTANLDDDPVATLRVGRHAGRTASRCGSRTRTASRCPRRDRRGRRSRARRSPTATSDMEELNRAGRSATATSSPATSGSLDEEGRLYDHRAARSC